MGTTEQSNYRVVDRIKGMEIRDYDAMVVAEVAVTGQRGRAVQDGFKMLADYIYGNNAGSREIAMTAPVVQQGKETCWHIRFVMPASEPFRSLPTPNDPKVRLTQVEPKRFAAIRFSGWANESNLDRHLDMLNSFVDERHLERKSGALYAFYDPPWTLPIWRRNEILIEVARP